MKSAMLGLGKSGMSVLTHLSQKREAIIGIDRKERIVLLQKETDVPLFSEEEFDLEGIDRLIVSPGIPRENPIYRRARERGLEITSDVELALELLECRLVGVTGTNGKTTTVERIAHVLRVCGYNAKAVGNNGDPLLYHLDTPREGVLVIELSSFQLEVVKAKKFECSVILNITPDHLDRYASFEEYAATKKRLIDLTLGPCFMPPFQTIATEIFTPEKENIYAASAICKEFGINEKQFFTALKTFKRPPHRLEFVKKVDQISFYNDSKGTTVDSVIFAVKSIEGAKVLLVGGKDKGLDFRVWRKEFDESVEAIIAFGEAKEKIQKELAPRFTVILTEDLEKAVHLAAKMARTNVILSPGCASYDQFKNFEERGERFKKIVEAL